MELVVEEDDLHHWKRGLDEIEVLWRWDGVVCLGKEWKALPLQ